MKITVLGLGEAGSLYARGLAEQGAEVTGFDPFTSPDLPGVELAPDLIDAVSASEVVLSLVGASAACEVVNRVVDAMAPSAVLADLNTAAPRLKQQLAARAHEGNVPFADVAVMAPVPRAGSKTPLLASGIGAKTLQKRLSEYGVPLEVVPGEAGTAAGRKLLRSVFMKGLAGLVFESVTAAERLDAGDWMQAQIAGELGPQGADMVERLITGTRLHAKRRSHEMMDAHAYLGELESPAWITEATLTWLQHLAADD